MIRRIDLLDLIEEGESSICEFKLRFSTPEKISKELIAFANTSGGYLIIGVDDSGKIAGVDSEKSETALVEDAAENYCEPPVKINIGYFEIDNEELVVVEVPESDTKPHRKQDYLDDIDVNRAEIYIRVNDKSVQASKEMIRVFKAESKYMKLKKYTVGKLEESVFKYLEDNETISVKELCKSANISERRASRTLVKMVRASLLFIHTKDNGEVYFTAAL